jgi:hypothetical protein
MPRIFLPTRMTWLQPKRDFSGSSSKLMATDFVLLSKNGTEYYADYLEESAVLEREINGEDDWDLNEINPGKGRTIVLIFAVPRNTEVDSVAWAGNDFLEDSDRVYHLKAR